MKNTKGLKPWKPGQSGNPNGRPRTGLAIADIARGEIERRGLIAKLGAIAARSSTQQVKAIELLLAYAYGKPHAELALEHRAVETDFQKLREMLTKALANQPDEVRYTVAGKLLEMDALTEAEAGGNGTAQ